MTLYNIANERTVLIVHKFSRTFYFREMVKSLCYFTDVSKSSCSCEFLTSQTCFENPRKNSEFTVKTVFTQNVLALYLLLT